MVGLNQNVRPATVVPSAHSPAPAVTPAPAGPAVPLADLKAQYALLRDEILPALDEVAASTAYVLGPKVSEFEANFAAYAGAKHCVGVN